MVVLRPSKIQKAIDAPHSPLTKEISDYLKTEKKPYTYKVYKYMLTALITHRLFHSVGLNMNGAGKKKLMDLYYYIGYYDESIEKGIIPDVLKKMLNGERGKLLLSTASSEAKGTWEERLEKSQIAAETLAGIINNSLGINHVEMEYMHKKLAIVGNTIDDLSDFREVSQGLGKKEKRMLFFAYVKRLISEVPYVLPYIIQDLVVLKDILVLTVLTAKGGFEDKAEKLREYTP